VDFKFAGQELLCYRDVCLDVFCYFCCFYSRIAEQAEEGYEVVCRVVVEWCVFLDACCELFCCALPDCLCRDSGFSERVCTEDDWLVEVGFVLVAGKGCPERNAAPRAECVLVLAEYFSIVFVEVLPCRVSASFCDLGIFEVFARMAGSLDANQVALFGILVGFLCE